MERVRGRRRKIRVVIEGLEQSWTGEGVGYWNGAAKRRQECISVRGVHSGVLMGH